MTKRKLSNGESGLSKDGKAADAKEQEEVDGEYAPGLIDTNPLKFLIAPTELATFTSEYWEKKPLHVPADEARKKFLGGLFGMDELAKMSDALEAGVMLLMDQNPGPKGDALSLEDDVDDEMVRAIGPLVFGRDVVAVQYVDGKRHNIGGDIADSDTLRALHDKAGATLQLHQPQRFINGLWRLVAALEAQAGCLVGCNAYITPPNGQGLAPHHDDVELFVCQTQGTKKWRLYKPVNGFELPTKCSGDLAQEGLGDPILEVTMQPGDVLYVPRGTVHQAVAQEEGSCHLTMSSYQRWTWGDLALKLLETARDVHDSPDSALPLELRKGLPLGTIFRHGIQSELTCKDSAAAADAARPDAAVLAAGLRALADRLEKSPVEYFEPAVDGLSLDFLIHRMPPHACQVLDQGEEPGPEDSLACRGKNLFRIVPYIPDEDEQDEQDEDEEEEEEEKDEDIKKPMVRLVTCLNNSRFTHMISTDDDEDEDEDEQHDHGLCNNPEHDHGASESDEDEEMVEEELDEKAKEGKKGGKGEEKEATKHEQEKTTEKAGKGKKSGKTEDTEEEDNGDEAEIVDLDDEEDGEGEDSDDEMSNDDDDTPQLQGPIFPAEYALALAEVLAATFEQPLPVKKLKVPGGDPEEQVRLALILHEAGFVATVPGSKEEEIAKEPSPVKKSQGKEGTDKAKKAKGKGDGAGAAKEEKLVTAPLAKKAKKGAK